MIRDIRSIRPSPRPMSILVKIGPRKHTSCEGEGKRPPAALYRAPDHAESKSKNRKRKGPRPNMPGANHNGGLL